MHFSHPLNDGDIRERDTVPHVDVEQAGLEFSQLNQQLQQEEISLDIENNKAIDLQDYLEGHEEKSAEDARKKMGITIKNLTVKGLAPNSKTIPTTGDLPIFFAKLFWPPAWYYLF